jgi:hypothetical protein
VVAPQRLATHRFDLRLSSKLLVSDLLDLLERNGAAVVTFSDVYPALKRFLDEACRLSEFDLGRTKNRPGGPLRPRATRSALIFWTFA